MSVNTDKLNIINLENKMKVQKHKTLAKAQNKNPFKSVIYNMKKRQKEGSTVHMKTYSPDMPVIPVEVVLFAQGSTFIVKTPTNEKMPDGYYTFANDGEKFWTPYNWNHIQAFLDGQAYPFQYKDMVVRLVNSETSEALTLKAQTIRVREPNTTNGSYHPVVFGLEGGKTITSHVWREDKNRLNSYKNQKSMDIHSNLNHVRLVFNCGGKEYDNCFIYFKLGTSQFDLSHPKGKYWNRCYQAFGL